MVKAITVYLTNGTKEQYFFEKDTNEVKVITVVKRDKPYYHDHDSFIVFLDKQQVIYSMRNVNSIAIDEA